MTRTFRRLTTLCASAITLLAATGTQAAGLDPESNTDGFDPAAESYRINEARRLNEISRQLELNYRMIWDHGFDPASPPVRQPIGQESKQLGPNRWLSRPIYPEDVAPTDPDFEGPELLPAPGATAPQRISPGTLIPRPKLPGPADARPGDRLVPKRPPAPRGPREF